MPLSFDNETVERFALHLGKAKKIVIVSHKNPDGDAVGASLGCYHWLKKAFITGTHSPEINILLPHPCPADTLYLPSSNIIHNAVNNPVRCDQLLRDADLIWGVDFNSANRIEPFDKPLIESKAVKLLCDHHHNPDHSLFNVVISIPDLSSTCELLYWLFVQMIGDSSISFDTARCLFHGINTDTGCFAYANEDSSLYEAAAALMKHPIHAAEVHNRTFNNYSVEKMDILGFLLTQRMKLFPEIGFCYIYINADDLAAHHGTAEDLEGLVNYTLMIQTINVGAMVKETDGKVRLSFRSKHDFDVNRFANKYFGGGGHLQASGATSEFDFDTTLRILEENMIKELSKNTTK